MDIPVEFEFEGKKVKGELSKVAGSGSSGNYHLMVDGFYWGQLSYISGHPGFNGLHAVPAGWRFTSNTKELGHLAVYFGNVVTGWLNTH